MGGDLTVASVRSTGSLTSGLQDMMLLSRLGQCSVQVENRGGRETRETAVVGLASFPGLGFVASFAGKTAL